MNPVRKVFLSFALALILTAQQNFAHGEVILPSVTCIGAEAFYGTAIKEVVISEGTKKISARAFAGTGLKKITLPRSISSIADDAFTGCSGLKAWAWKDSYAWQYCKSQKITVYARTELKHASLKDGLIVLPDTTAVANKISIGVVCTGAWKLTLQDLPGNSPWIDVSPRSGQGSATLTVTVKTVPGKVTNVYTRDNFASRLILTDSRNETFSVIITLRKSGSYINTYLNTGDYMEDMIAVALTQVGYQGGSTYADIDGIPDTNVTRDYTKYGLYMKINGNPWCACFISWCAFQAGIPSSKITAGTYARPDCLHPSVKEGKPPVTYFITPSTVYRLDYFLEYGKKLSRRRCAPKRGDLIFFRWPNATADVAFSHVGLVLDYNSGKITYIDGNGGEDIVKVRTVAHDDPYIAAYFSPW